MAKVLVTGATGFVGRHLVPALVALGHEVRCAVLRKVHGLQAEQVLINKIELQSDWTQALTGVDVVIHLAARVHVMSDSSTSPEKEYDQVNALATKRLAEQAAAMKVQRFVYLSSIKVNGEFSSRAPFTEEVLDSPIDPYGLSKWKAEKYLKAVSEQGGMDFVVLRPPLVYGPGVKANFLKMMHWVQKGWPLPFAQVSNKRHFIYIDNLVSALCAVLENPKAANQVFLVADEEAFSLAQLLRQLAKGMNRTVFLMPVPVRAMSFVFALLGLKNLNARLFGCLEVNASKIKSEIGWTPPVSASEGLEKTARWYQRELSA
jgi:nucleoside-diphosphate-sugar epimerase